MQLDRGEQVWDDFQRGRESVRPLRSERVEFETGPESSQAIEHVSTKEGYDRWAMIYDDEDNPLIVLEERHLPGLLGDVQGLDVIDLGCGTGRHAVRLVAAEITAVGIPIPAARFREASREELGLVSQALLGVTAR